jgi:putative oxidoreductase
LPLAPLGWAIAVAFEIGGGLLLVLGFQARAVAFALAVFVLATAVFFHRNFADQNQMIHFLKNIMMTGGLLQIAHFGAGRYSLDARSAKGGAGASS